MFMHLSTYWFQIHTDGVSCFSGALFSSVGWIELMSLKKLLQLFGVGKKNKKDDKKKGEEH
jgi:hypothetical protein